MTNQINYADIRSFLVLVEQGSFTKAAEVLQCSRSQISKQLTQLEGRLGVTLLVRTTRSQHLTSIGESFYDSCKQAYASIDNAIDMAKDQAGELSGEIAINSVGGFIGENIIGPLVSEFMQQNPGIKVKLDFSSQRVDLVTGDFDFVFRMGQLDDSALIARKLTDLKVGTYASPSYLARMGKPQHPKDLAQHKCISGSMRQWQFTHLQSQEVQEVQVQGELECKNGRVMLHSAKAGNGIVRVPEIYCEAEVKAKQLVEVFDYWRPNSSPFYLVYLKDQYQPVRVRAFKEFALAHFSR